jgi:hypothetical protein
VAHSSDPSYWRKKAIEFRGRAQIAAADDAAKLAKHAHEFDRIALALEAERRGELPSGTGRWSLFTLGALGGTVLAGLALVVIGVRWIDRPSADALPPSWPSAQALLATPPAAPLSEPSAPDEAAPDAIRGVSGNSLPEAPPLAVGGEVRAGAAENLAAESAPATPPLPPALAEDAPPPLPGRAAPLAARRSSVAAPAAAIVGIAPLKPRPAKARAAQGDAGSGAECSRYTAAAGLAGDKHPVSGTACRLPSGHWRLLSELPDSPRVDTR